MSVFVRRTLTSGPPPDLAFGEVAYSDGDQVLHVGRADPVEPPTAFNGNPTDYAPEIAALEAAQTAQGTALAAIPDYSTAIADLETTQGTQAGAIAALALDVDALETSQAGQDSAIAALTSDVAALESAPPPVTGWDYIGPTEPIAPAVGFTWWERSVGGSPLGRWFWTGSLWAELEISLSSSPAAFNLNATSSAPSTNICVAPRQNSRGAILERFALTFWATDLFINSTDDWVFTGTTRGGNVFASPGLTLFTGAKLSDQVSGVTGSFVTYLFAVEFAAYSNYSFASNSSVSLLLFRLEATKMNAAPNLSGCLAHLFWRYVR